MHATEYEVGRGQPFLELAAYDHSLFLVMLLRLTSPGRARVPTFLDAFAPRVLFLLDGR